PALGSPPPCGGHVWLRPGGLGRRLGCPAASLAALKSAFRTLKELPKCLRRGQVARCARPERGGRAGERVRVPVGVPPGWPAARARSAGAYGGGTAAPRGCKPPGPGVIIADHFSTCWETPGPEVGGPRPDLDPDPRGTVAAPG